MDMHKKIYSLGELDSAIPFFKKGFVGAWTDRGLIGDGFERNGKGSKRKYSVADAILFHVAFKLVNHGEPAAVATKAGQEVSRYMVHWAKDGKTLYSSMLDTEDIPILMFEKNGFDDATCRFIPRKMMRTAGFNPVCCCILDFFESLEPLLTDLEVARTSRWRNPSLKPGCGPDGMPLDPNHPCYQHSKVVAA